MTIKQDKRRAGGFTLIELMVAIVIVALLAGMTIIGTRVAVRTAKESAVKLQMEQLSMALDKYKNEIGEYPPDFSDPIAVMRHVKKRWPRCAKYGLSLDGFHDFCADINTQTNGGWEFYLKNHPDYWDAAYVAPLVFWLGGLPDSTGKSTGFCLSPTDPLGIDGATAQREEPRFAFPDGTTVTENGIPAFVPRKDGIPILYFLAASDHSDAYMSQIWADETPTGNYISKYRNLSETLGIAGPYAKSIGIWFEPDRFQLIHPGLDGVFSEVSDSSVIRTINDKNTLSSADADNIVNFTQGGTLDSEYPENK